MNTKTATRPPEYDMLERRLPYDLDAEQATIGSLFYNGDALDELRAILQPKQFFDEANRTLYEHLRAMRDEGIPIDSTLLVDRLKRAGHWETIGGAAYLYRVAQRVANAANVIYYARVVAEKARLRGIIQASAETLREAYEDRLEAREILSLAEDRLFAIRDEAATPRAKPIKEFCHDTMQAIDAAMRGEGEAAIPTGFTDLDRQLGGGFRPGELVIVAARPSVGKSALSGDFAVSIAEQHLAAFFSLEMSGRNLCERMLSSVANVEGLRIRNRTLSPNDLAKIVNAGAELSSLQLYVDDASQQRVGDIAASCRMIERETGKPVELIVVDYLQLVTADDPRTPREQQVTGIGRRLKQLARERQCPVVAVCSVNRKSEDGNDKRPKLSNLRESGSLEFEADIVLLLHREEYYRRGEDAEDVKGKAEVIIAKQRNGPCGTVELQWDAKHTRFRNLAPERLQEFDDYNDDRKF